MAAKKISSPAKGTTGKAQTSGTSTPSAHWLARSWRPVLYWTAVAGCWSVLGLFMGLFILALNLPDVHRLPAPAAGKPSVIVKSAGGAILVRQGPLVGDFLPYREIPDALVQAFIAIEDRRFFSHMGVDPKGLARAALANMWAGGVRAGGSTITQQLAKNLFLTPERSLIRKAREALLAVWLESAHSKERLLSEYLNRIYFGGGAYGIDAASQKYFGHSARSLTVKEAAILAGLVKAPSRLAPHQNPDGAWTRAKLVLGAMAATGALTDNAAEALSARPPAIKQGLSDDPMRYATDWIIARAKACLPDYAGTMVVSTTLDPSLQAAASETIGYHLKTVGQQQRASQAALVSLDTDGAVKALVGGRSYKASSYNRASVATRQPGSAFKYFVYLAALERGVEPEDIYRDEPVSVGAWSPANYSGRYGGDMSVEEAFARSINTVAVKLNEDMGRSRSIAVAQRLGLKTPLSPVPSLPLGTEEVRLLDLTGAYGAVASGGFLVEPYGITEIRGTDGELLYRRPTPKPVPVLSHTVVRKMGKMMASVITSGSGRRAAIDRPAAGKSGTSQDNRDAVFVGFTADIITAVWVGNDDNSAMKGTTGSGLPAAIWRDFMIEAHAGAPVRALLADGHLYKQSAATPKPKGRSLLQRLFGGR